MKALVFAALTIILGAAALARATNQVPQDECETVKNYWREACGFNVSLRDEFSQDDQLNCLNTELSRELRNPDFAQKCMAIRNPSMFNDYIISLCTRGTVQCPYEKTAGQYIGEIVATVKTAIIGSSKATAQ